MRGPHRGREILGADALVHAGLIVVAAEQIAERIEHIGFRAFRQVFRPIGLNDQRLGAVAISLAEQRAGQRQPPLCRQRMIGGEAMHRRRADLVVPQPRFGAPAHQRHAGPIGIADDERRVAGEIGVRL